MKGVRRERRERREGEREGKRKEGRREGGKEGQKGEGEGWEVKDHAHKRISPRTTFQLRLGCRDVLNIRNVITSRV